MPFTSTELRGRHVVVAPDSFKGSVSAADAARAIADGWRRRRPDDTLRLIPMADGGEGTIDAIRAATSGSREEVVEVLGPRTASVRSSWLLAGDTAVVELARSSGLPLAGTSAPLDTHTYGFGATIRAALERRPRRLLLALGGSSSTDGGSGALRALGVRFLDRDGRDIAPGNRGLADLCEVDWTDAVPCPEQTYVLADVTNPLIGPTGAAHVFGRQKGATAAQVVTMDANLSLLAEVVGRSRSMDSSAPGAGAAGGTAFGLQCWGAEVTSGAHAVAELCGLPDAVREATVVVTGEGSFDAQSGSGKVVSHVLGLAVENQAACLLVAGRVSSSTSRFEGSRSLTELAGTAAAAVDEAPRWLALAASQLAEGLDDAHARPSPNPTRDWP